jgi:hypothetical protein
MHFTPRQIHLSEVIVGPEADLRCLLEDNVCVLQPQILLLEVVGKGNPDVGVAANRLSRIDRLDGPREDLALHRGITKLITMFNSFNPLIY